MAMNRTWQTEEMAVNRIKMVEDTQILMSSLTKQITRRGIPTRPEMRSENASETRNMLVSVLNVFFLWIKKMTRPLTIIISRHMKDKITIKDGARSFGCPEFVSLLGCLLLPLKLHVLDDSWTNCDIFFARMCNFSFPELFLCFRAWEAGNQLTIWLNRIQLTADQEIWFCGKEAKLTFVKNTSQCQVMMAHKHNTGVLINLNVFLNVNICSLPMDGFHCEITLFAFF